MQNSPLVMGIKEQIAMWRAESWKRHMGAKIAWLGQWMAQVYLCENLIDLYKTAYNYRQQKYTHRDQHGGIVA